MVSEPPDFSSERCAGPQIAIVPPSTRSMRAWPDFTRMSLPLRSMVLTWPRTSSTLIGPCSAMASPSIVPTASPAACRECQRRGRRVGPERPRRLLFALCRARVVGLARCRRRLNLSSRQRTRRHRANSQREKSRAVAVRRLFSLRRICSQTATSFRSFIPIRQFRWRSLGNFVGDSTGIISSRWLRGV